MRSTIPGGAALLSLRTGIHWNDPDLRKVQPAARLITVDHADSRENARGAAASGTKIAHSTCSHRYEQAAGVTAIRKIRLKGTIKVATSFVKTRREICTL